MLKTVRQLVPEEEIKESGVILQSLAITLQVVLDGLATKERSEVVLGKAI
jgi:hypothetical protein